METKKVATTALRLSITAFHFGNPKQPSKPTHMIARVTVLALALSFSFTAAASAQDVAALELKPSANPTSPLSYDKAELTVKAGQKVKLTLNNTGGILPQPHNFVLMKSGTLDKVGALANAMLSDPKAMDKSYIPESPDIITSMKLVQPGQTDSIEFTAPAEAGDYPYACTFPGHWLLMRGVLKVTK
jgi:azurin